MVCQKKLKFRCISKELCQDAILLVLRLRPTREGGVHVLLLSVRPVPCDAGLRLSPDVNLRSGGGHPAPDGGNGDAVYRLEGCLKLGRVVIRNKFLFTTMKDLYSKYDESEKNNLTPISNYLPEAHPSQQKQMVMTPRGMLRACVAANGSLTLAWIVAITYFSSVKRTSAITNYSMGNFMQVGPNKYLNVMGLVLDTWSSYTWFVCCVVIFRVVQTWVHEIAHPIIGFRIYDPDLKVVKDFTRCELQVYGNLMYMFDAVRKVFMTMVSITQIDIAMWGTLAGEITSIFTIRRLLRAKEFTLLQEDREPMLPV